MEFLIVFVLAAVVFSGVGVFRVIGAVLGGILAYGVTLILGFIGLMYFAAYLGKHYGPYHDGYHDASVIEQPSGPPMMVQDCSNEYANKHGGHCSPPFLPGKSGWRRLKKA
jgi:hypothetical protein